MPRIDDLGLRADTAAGWAAAEVGGPATTAGENVWIDNDLVKCDGVTKVNDLPRAGSGTYAPLGVIGGLAASLRRDQLAARFAAPGCTLVASAPGAASAVSGSVSVPSITNTGTGAVNPLFRYGRCVPVQKSAAAFENQCVVSSGYQTYKGALDMLAEFDYSGHTTVEIRYRAQLASKLRVWVDGRPVNPIPVTTPADGNFSYYTLTLPDTGRHKIGVEMGADFTFLGAYRAGAATLTPPQDASGGTLIVIGDSYVGATGASSRFEGWATSMGTLLGFPRVVSSGAGGTGYLADNTAAFPAPHYRSRLSNDVFPFVSGDTTIIVSGGINDAAFTQAQISAEATALFAAIKAGAPTARIGVILPFSPAGTPTAQLTTSRAAVIEAATASGVKICADPIGDSWITGTGRVGSTTGDGNADYFVGSDGVHLTQDGHDHVAVLAAAGVRRSLGL